MLWDYVHDRPRAIAERQQLILVLAWAGIALLVFAFQLPGGSWWVLGSWVVTTTQFYLSDRLRVRAVQDDLNMYRDQFNTSAKLAKHRNEHNNGLPLGPSQQQFYEWMSLQPAPVKWAPMRPLPVIPIYCLVSLSALALYGTRDLLAHRHLGIGPEQAPAIIATVTGLPGLLLAVLMVIPRVIRAWGAASKDTDTGEAAKIRAWAELRRAEAAILLAQQGITSLPAPPPPGDADELPPPPDGAEPEP
ncbi:hypothetical protein PO587_27555 [Streptomyces gilvifuscus]|uniref:Uncharacterized protein n=1 Tax=Streptomyces gilvifuscus TaxID=1550617 RepID=A0ABT5G097_9ACTN|nr:hypothetical protein [Streptomyces gilvifuscus]MDC2958203.1 hypothetical protein [Streptomyces gilvifuscus]